MLIAVATRSPDLEVQLCEALECLGWPSDAVGAAGAGDASALIADVDHPALEAAEPRLPRVLLIAGDADLAQLRSAGPCVLLRKPFTQAALANALAAALPGRAARPLAPIAVAPAMRAIAARLDSLAKAPITLAFTGEIGTGKTHWARWAHACSARARGPLIEVSGGALQAATGRALRANARSHEPDPIEWSHGGTLLVEEVGDLTAADQHALLRLLIEALSPNGARVDTRVIATSRRGLAADVAEGRLQRALAARLAGAEIDLPPLRERADELPALARRFLERAPQTAGLSPELLDAQVAQALAESGPPSNLHELESRMVRWALLGAARSSDRPEPPARHAPERGDASEELDLRTLERRAIERAIALCAGDRRQAARRLGIHVRTLRNKLRASPAGVPR